MINNNEESIFKKFLLKNGMNIKEFSVRFGVPYSTCQSWNVGRRNPPEYLLNIIEKNIKLEESNAALMFLLSAK